MFIIQYTKRGTYMNLKKITIAILFLSTILLSGLFVNAKENIKQISEKTSYSEVQNNLWCVTFQLVWNDFLDKINDGNPVILEPETPEIAQELNKREFSSDILSEESYYVKSGKISKSLKKEIEKNLKKKFKEKSDILSMIDWNAKNSYLFYSILKKDFNYKTPFDKLNNTTFNNSDENVKYFGKNEKSNNSLNKNVSVLLFNGTEEYAIKLQTKEKEDVILYRTEKKDSLQDAYYNLINNTNEEKFTNNDYIKIPYINVNKTVSYDELCGKKIKDKNYMITQALQTIKFDLDDKGGRLKSEAAMTIMKTSLLPPVDKRYFSFDKPFYLFLKEENRNKPYFAMYIENTDYLVKE